MWIYISTAPLLNGVMLNYSYLSTGTALTLSFRGLLTGFTPPRSIRQIKKIGPQLKPYLAFQGLAIAQVVSCRLPMAETRVRSQVRLCGICGGQSGTGVGFLRVLRFPLPILIPLNAPYSSIIRGWYNRPHSGRRTKRTRPHSTPRNKNYYYYYYYGWNGVHSAS
jgi:hypothetical protein